MKPAAICLDEISGNLYISNPESNNVSIIDFFNNSNVLVDSGSSPMGLSVDKTNNFLFCS